MADLNYNVGIRFEAMGGLLKSLDRFKTSSAAAGAGITGLTSKLINLKTVGVAVFAALEEGARRYNAQVVRLRGIGFHGAQLRGMQSEALNLAKRGSTGYSLNELLGMQGMVAQATGYNAPGLIQQVARSSRFLTIAGTMKAPGAEATLQKLLGAAGAYQQRVSYAMPVAQKTAQLADTIRLATNLMVGLQGIGGHVSGSAFARNLGSLLRQPGLAKAVPIGHLVRETALMTARGPAAFKGWEDVLRATLGSQSNTAMFMSLGIPIRVAHGGIQSAIAGQAISLAAGRRMLAYHPLDFVRRYVMPSLEAPYLKQMGLHHAVPWPELATKYPAIAKKIIREAPEKFPGMNPMFMGLLGAVTGRVAGPQDPLYRRVVGFMHEHPGYEKKILAGSLNYQYLQLIKNMESLADVVGKQLVPPLLALTKWINGFLSHFGISAARSLSKVPSLGTAAAKAAFVVMHPLDAWNSESANRQQFFNRIMSSRSFLPGPSGHHMTAAAGTSGVQGLMSAGRITGAVIYNTFNITAGMDPQKIVKGVYDGIARSTNSGAIGVTPALSGGYGAGR